MLGRRSSCTVQQANLEHPEDRGDLFVTHITLICDQNEEMFAKLVQIHTRFLAKGGPRPKARLYRRTVLRYEHVRNRIYSIPTLRGYPTPIGLPLSGINPSQTPGLAGGNVSILQSTCSDTAVCLWVVVAIISPSGCVGSHQATC